MTDTDVPQKRVAGTFLRSLTTDRKFCEDLTFEDAANKSKVPGGTTLFEVLKGGELYIPYTDCDHYCDSPDRPSDEFINEVQCKMFSNLNKLVMDQCHDGCSLRMATRHGVDAKKNVYKLSFRCYLGGFVIKLADMRDIIVRKGLDKCGVGSFDKAPYNKNQLLGRVGFYKSDQDSRILKPASDGTLEDFMVQNTTGEERLLKYIECKEESTAPATTRSNSPEHSDNIDGPRFAPPWDVLVQLVMALSVETRCARGTYDDWAKVGWAIAGVARSTDRFEDGLVLWLGFCRQSPVYYENPIKALIIYQSATAGNSAGSL